jgi:hypothetical protein
MKANGLRLMIYRFILLILLSLYFTLVFGQGTDSGVAFKHSNYPVTEQSIPKLLSFDGMFVDKQVKLNWKFETTAGLDECVLERSDSLNDFKPVAYFFMTEDIHIPALKFTDKTQGSKTYFYRLKLTGKDGNTDYSKVITVKINGDQKKQ